MVAFWCPGCKTTHAVGVEDGCRGQRWGYNGNPERPTFTPSVLIYTSRPTEAGKQMVRAWQAAGSVGAPPKIPMEQFTLCHSFVTDGRIQFLGDCAHALAGQTVDLPDWTEEGT